ncbi:unnamed protein product, partial [Cyprideis torosa]
MPKSFSRSQSDASATFLLHLQRFAVDCSVGYTPDGSCPVEKDCYSGRGVRERRIRRSHGESVSNRQHWRLR